eukprot:6368464-Pyramimonas_sp.AAC.1
MSGTRQTFGHAKKKIDHARDMALPQVAGEVAGGVVRQVQQIVINIFIQAGGRRPLSLGALDSGFGRIWSGSFYRFADSKVFVTFGIPGESPGRTVAPANVTGTSRSPARGERLGNLGV